MSLHIKTEKYSYIFTYSLRFSFFKKKKKLKIISERYLILFLKDLGFNKNPSIYPGNPNSIWSCSEVKREILTSICCHGNN